DFSGNAISSIEKRVWKGYPWAEYLVLKDNDLRKLQKDSLEGLLSLKHVDLSCNKIQFIEKQAFEPLPFLQFINLGGNLITELQPGTFQAWHGMQFLQKLVLSHNPLSVVADTSLFTLPSLAYLDLGATQVTQKTFKTLLLTALRLETLRLPSNMACCLCQMKENIEILCKTVKLHCEHSCATNSSLCVHEEPFEQMQEELMKVLEARKLNASAVLHLQPEEPSPQSDNAPAVPGASRGLPNAAVDLDKPGELLAGVNYLFFKHLSRPGERNSAELAVLPGSRLLNFNVHQGEGLLKLLADQASLLARPDFEHMDWASEAELQEKLKKVENGSGISTARAVLEPFLTTPATHESQAHRTGWQTPAVPGHLRGLLKATRLCGELAEQCTKALSGHRHGRKNTPERTKQCEDYQVKCAREGKEEKPPIKGERATRGAQEERCKGPACGFSRLRREPKAAFKSQMQMLIPVSRHPEIPQRHSLAHLPTQASRLAVSFKVENTSEDLTGKIIIFLEHANKTENPPKFLFSENMARKGVPISTDIIIFSRSHFIEKPSVNTDSSLDGLLPSIHRANETHWKHQPESSTRPYALPGSSAPDNYSVQGDLFEAELNGRLRSLIPNQAVRNLISHVIRTLKMDCTEPRVQLACAKLISKTGLLMKLFSEREDIKESSPLWRAYLWESEQPPNPGPRHREAGKTDAEEFPPEPPQYSYGNKLLLAISVTVVIMIIIAVICLIEV
uniref:LRRC37A/B like protein 1 C-terminal domain-containing protein n=1 Tax=Pelodiscus sinensis TaxID=13735 RepID=K7FBS5_PELSI